MLTRREALLAAAGFVAAGARAEENVPAGTPEGGELLGALPGKKPLIQRAFRPPNFETPLADLAPLYTGNAVFFVRYHLPVIPRVDAALWRLQIGGPSAQRSLALSLRELKGSFPQVSLAAVNQCAGNRRGRFAPRVPGVQWGNGALGNALWSGVRLRDVLHKAGVAADALEVVFNGADTPLLPGTPDFVKSLPIDRALDESTLIALEMNGQALPHWNGAPARLIVPGWTGTYWMKHLTDIRIQPAAFDGFWMKSAYRVPTGAFPTVRFVSQETPETTPITEMLVNSLITSPTPAARLRRGAPAQLTGKAWDAGAGIAAVEVSVDGRQSWREATLGRDLGRFAWREFHLPLDTSKGGPLEIAVRARSRNGASQPQALTFNPSGYHDNRVQTVRVEVS
ncbi:MAG TPA: molybdopterin-dependent oxidoreductase [Steroidobacteraceae bacterium]|jgi:DMSO/TMAO reductase YedYZ molybdopterin-dependent catalytic subunit|nr:molybdopterin-dependent oxidoreductase [Steroidobacteraceae bacterium]